MTYQIIGIDEADVAVANFQCFTPANYVEVDTKVNEDGSRETVLQRVAGEGDYPATVRIGVYPKITNGVNTYNVSIRFNTFVQKLDEESAVLETRPISFVLAWTAPWAPVPDVDDLFAAIGNLYSMAVPDVTLGEFTPEFLAKLGFSVTKLDLSTVVRTT